MVNLGDDDRIPQVDLHSERYQVRQSAERNTFTGKTYNSLENISQFFAERGVPFPVQKPPNAGSPPGIPHSTAARCSGEGAPAGGAAQVGTHWHDGGASEVWHGNGGAARGRRRRCQDYSQLSALWAEEAGGKIRGAEERLSMDTTAITDRMERKKLKRAARKKAAPKAKRAAGVARGSMKKKVKKMVQGQRKR